MARLMLSLDGNVLAEYNMEQRALTPLSASRITIFVSIIRQ